ncbi:hypothetical protein BC828DRAFT_381404 [Blastocladiella britannica]|nr:hypothetical protein BC828DRAFT_381404 [Blastocladiella britannica]
MCRSATTQSTIAIPAPSSLAAITRVKCPRRTQPCLHILAANGGCANQWYCQCDPQCDAVDTESRAPCPNAQWRQLLLLVPCVQGDRGDQVARQPVHEYCQTSKSNRMLDLVRHAERKRVREPEHQKKKLPRCHYCQQHEARVAARNVGAVVRHQVVEVHSSPCVFFALPILSPFLIS